MSERVELYVLAVGQGSCNLVAVYDEEDHIVLLDLVDCGRIGGGMEQQDLSGQMDFIHQMMKKRAETLKVPDLQYYLDHLIISHADGDHINLLTEKYFLKGLIPAPDAVEGVVIAFSYGEVYPECDPELHEQPILLEISCGRQGEYIVLYTLERDCEQEDGTIVNLEICINWNVRSIEDYELNTEISAITCDYMGEDGFYHGYIEYGWYIIDSDCLCKMAEFMCNIENDQYSIRLEGEQKEDFAGVLFRCTIESVETKELCNSSEKEVENVQEDVEEIMSWLYAFLEGQGLEDFSREWHIIEYIFGIIIPCMMSFGDFIETLTVQVADSILKSEKMQGIGTCCIEKIYMGGLASLSSGSKKKSVNTILKKLGSYSPEAINYMEEDVIEENQNQIIFLAKLPPKGLTNQQKNYMINDENSCSITYLLAIDDEWRLMLPGDATGDTMWHFCNKVWGQYNVPEGVWMTAPHHGSSVTGVSQVFQPEESLLEQYLGTIQPQGMIISAGYQNVHGHPHNDFLTVAEIYMLKANESKHVLDFSMGRKLPWGVQYTDKNIFSCLKEHKDSSGSCRAYCNWKITFAGGDISIEEEKVLTRFSQPPQPQMNQEDVEQKVQPRRTALPSCGGTGFDFLI